MAIVSPFRGIHYDLSRVTNLSRVISQPYDVISPEEQQSLHQRHPRNIVWIDFGLDSEGDGPTANKYTRAATWDRLSLMRATEANTSPIFGLYSDPRDEVAKVLRGRLAGTPDFSATDDLGVKHRMWRGNDPAALPATAEKDR